MHDAKILMFIENIDKLKIIIIYLKYRKKYIKKRRLPCNVPNLLNCKIIYVHFYCRKKHKRVKITFRTLYILRHYLTYKTCIMFFDHMKTIFSCIRKI